MIVPRRIQVTGRNTFIVSLPQGWIAKNDLKKGGQVYPVEQSDGTLLLSVKETSKGQKTVTIEVMGTHESSMRNVVSAYVGGAHTIILTGNGVSTVAEETRRILSGVEISDEDAGRIVLKVLSMEELDVDKLLNRAYKVTLNMFSLAGDLFGRGAVVHTEIARKEDEVDRLHLVLLRSLSEGGVPSSEAVFRAMVAKSMEKVSDHLEDLCGSAGETRNPPIAALIGKASAAYSIAFLSFAGTKPDHDEFSRAKSAFQADLAAIDAKIAKEKNPAAALAMRSLSEKCVKIVRYAEDIMETATDVFFVRMP
ncbi:MAG: phosphate uptake regulator PhoU [Candidatus Micrarchaeia archaeon]